MTPEGRLYENIASNLIEFSNGLSRSRIEVKAAIPRLKRLGEILQELDGSQEFPMTKLAKYYSMPLLSRLIWRFKNFGLRRISRNDIISKMKISA
jgi:hypothetical protein